LVHAIGSAGWFTHERRFVEWTEGAGYEFDYAEITSAVPLPADKVQAIEASLATASGARVVITPRVDPAILGGIVAKVGSRVYDGSVARHLARIRARLVSGDSLQ